MEAYTLSQFLYWKYYVMVLYYRLMEFPSSVRYYVLFASGCIAIMAVLILRSVIEAYYSAFIQRREREAYDRNYENMKIVALYQEVLDTSEIAQMIGLPQKYRMRPKQMRFLIPMLLHLYQKNRKSINKTNWRRMLTLLKVPAYFELKMRSRRTRDRILALKNVADMGADLKEAVASRYLFSRDKKLQNSARLHAARYGVSYPFKVIEEDPSLVFTQELMVKYHNVLLYRNENGLPMPNLVQWCTRVPVNEDLREFAVNEIRLFGNSADCPDLLNMLKGTHDERFSCALIGALGDLGYVPAMDELVRRYAAASFRERRVIADALGKLGNDSRETVDFLVEAYRRTTDYESAMNILRILDRSGENGRAAFRQLRDRASQEHRILFDHIECKYINSERYA